MADLFNDFKEFISGESKKTPSQTSGNSIIDSKTKNIYVTGEGESGSSTSKNSILQNWYKQKPYGFKFVDRDNTTYTFYLPIAPSNINITTHFATNVISTMYGTVEEHSEQRYYDIVISGTTGISPRYYKLIEDQVEDLSNGQAKVVGRAVQPIKATAQSSLGGFFKRTVSLIQNTLNQVSDVLGVEDEPTTGIDAQRTGYAAFHNFYKFLLLYKKDVSGEDGRGNKRRRHPLSFVNYKDNNQYDVAVQTFQLTKDAQDPMLYNYNIVMRAYNLRTADELDTASDLGERIEELGLSLESSTFSKIAGKARQAKNAGYSLVAAARGFGS